MCLTNCHIPLDFTEFSLRHISRGVLVHNLWAQKLTRFPILQYTQNKSHFFSILQVDFKWIVVKSYCQITISIAKLAILQETNYGENTVINDENYFQLKMRYINDIGIKMNKFGF